MFRKTNRDNIYYTNVFRRIKANIVDSIVIIISIFMTLTCLIINSYSKQLSTLINQIEFINTDSKTLTVTTKEYESVLDNSNVSLISNLWPCKSYNFYAEENFGTLYIENKNFYINALGVGFFDKQMILPSYDQLGATEKVKLINGFIPKFSTNTEDEYIYLHSAVKNFVFGEKTDAVGKEMQFYYNSAYHNFKIAGVLSDTLDVLRLVDKFDEKNSSIASNLNTLPIVFASKKLNNISKMLLFMEKEISNDNLEKMRQTLSSSSLASLEITALNEQLESRNKIVKASDRVVRIILNIVTFVLIGISVLLIFFSIKKRKAEIGIRKSLGANNLNLTVMFLSEIIYCFVLSCLYSIPISTFVMFFISVIIKKEVFSLLFPINFSIFATPICLIFLVVIFSSLITTMYFSNKKISSCLKE